MSYLYPVYCKEGEGDDRPGFDNSKILEWEEKVKRTEWEKKGDFLSKKNQLSNRINLEESEKRKQESLCKAEREELEREQRIIQGGMMADAIKERRKEEIRQNAFRLKMLENAPELKELESQLKKALYAKTLYAQRVESEAKRLEEKMRQLESHQMLMEEMARAEAEEERRALEEAKRKYEYSRALQSQMTHSRSHQALGREENLKDREMIDEIVNSIKREEIQDFMERKQKRDSYQKDIEEFFRMREEHRQREAEELKIEDLKIQEFVQTKEYQMELFSKVKAERDRTKASVISKTVQDMMKSQYEKEELEELRRELYEEEMAKKVREQEEEERQRRVQHIIELRRSAEEAQRIRAEKLEQEKREEEEYRRQLMAKFIQDERSEQMTKEIQRQKEREYRAKVEELMIQRRALKAQDREMEQKQTDCIQSQEIQRNAIIEEERLKLLKEYAPKIGFIPKGVIKSQKELEMLGEPFLTYYKNNPGREQDKTTIALEGCEIDLFKNYQLSKQSKNRTCIGPNPSNSK